MDIRVPPYYRQWSWRSDRDIPVWEKAISSGFHVSIVEKRDATLIVCTATTTAKGQLLFIHNKKIPSGSRRLRCWNHLEHATVTRDVVLRNKLSFSLFVYLSIYVSLSIYLSIYLSLFIWILFYSHASIIRINYVAWKVRKFQ